MKHSMCLLSQPINYIDLLQRHQNKNVFQHINEVLKQIDEDYHFVMPHWLLIFITELRTCISNISEHSLVV